MYDNGIYNIFKYKNIQIKIEINDQTNKIHIVGGEVVDDFAEFSTDITNNWTNICMKYNLKNKKLSIYVLLNTILILEKVISNINTNSKSLEILKNINSDNIDNYKIRIDDFRIYSRELPLEEIYRYSFGNKTLIL